MLHLIHEANLRQKLAKEKDKTNLQYLVEIKSEYDKWIAALQELDGLVDDESIGKRVALFNEYKDFIDQPKYKKEGGNKNGFTSQSKLHSTVLEEFICHLLAQIPCIAGKKLELGPSNAYSNAYFAPSNLEAFEEASGLTINTKNQDFAISKPVTLSAKLESSEVVQEQTLYVPVVSIECKTYLDKTMYEGAVATAEKIKRGNPYSLFLIVTETYEVSLDVDPAYSDIDQIYVLRKGSSASGGGNPIFGDVVLSLYKTVENHLTSNWKDIQKRLATGMLI